ncbi:MAG: methyltransferase domain-containing protein [Halanaerobium sp.]
MGYNISQEELIIQNSEEKIRENVKKNYTQVIETNIGGCCSSSSCCGAGFDVFLAARKVGEKGRFIGIEMTEAMISKAKNNAQKMRLKM